MVFCCGLIRFDIFLAAGLHKTESGVKSIQVKTKSLAISVSGGGRAIRSIMTQTKAAGGAGRWCDRKNKESGGAGRAGQPAYRSINHCRTTLTLCISWPSGSPEPHTRYQLLYRIQIRSVDLVVAVPSCQNCEGRVEFV